MIRFGLVDERGRITARSSAPSGGDIKGTIVEIVRRAFDQQMRPVGIGLGIAAWVRHGVPLFAPNLRSCPNLRAPLAETYDVAVVVENDANAAAFGEWKFGAGTGTTNMLMVTLGTGIGGGAIINGEIYRGGRGFASEFGHITLDDGGPECACGNKGCFEALASGTALGRIASEKQAELWTGEGVAEAARRGEAFALESIGEAGYWLGVGLSCLAFVFDPELIVIGGGAASADLLEPAVGELAERWRGKPDPPRVVRAQLGSDAGVIGAASLALAVDKEA